MNTEILQAISIAGFLHDLGKFAERARSVEKEDKDFIFQEYRYAHAYHTELALKDLFATERLEKRIGDNAEQTLVNMASRHHKPRNIYEKIIAQADQIASGHERTSGDEESDYNTGGRERKSQTPLLSILSRIQLKDAPATPEGDWRYRISRAGIAASSHDFKQFFPISKDQYSYTAVQEDYIKIWAEFKTAIKPSQDIGLDVFDHFQTIFAICREYLWCLPASTRKEELPDVSLFDHQKVTAALAACIYYFHVSNNTLHEQDVFKRNTDKFILFCGDISGIQKFIYQISSKGAYRTLKGKSFYIQLLAEIFAQEFIESFKLTVTNILYASGGKFYLMLPNTEDVCKKLSELQNSVNSDLFHHFNGDLYLRTGYKALSAKDLTSKNGQTLYQIWDQLTRQLVYQDRQRYKNMAAKHYDQLFAVRPEEELASCVVCHRTISRPGEGTCYNCKEMKEMGRQLGTTSCIAIGTGQGDVSSRNRPIKIRNKYVWFLEKIPGIITGKKVVLYEINSTNFQHVPLEVRCSFPVNSVPLVVGSTYKFDSTFDEIAKRAEGIKRLGILRMDVDNLGKVFSEGLENYKHGLYSETKRFHTLGRITTLSWQLSQFFGAVLPALIAQHRRWCKKVTVVYSGGDDLFLLGAWDELPEVALEIRNQFSVFSCHNSSFSLSGGMVITGGSFPVYKSADMAGEAELLAKKNRTVFRKQDTRMKDSFTFFETAMHWQEFEELARFQKKLLEIVQEPANYPLLHRLRDIALSWQGSRDKLKRLDGTCSLREIHERIEADKWRWRMVYALSRFTDKKSGQLKDDVKELQRFIVSKVAGTERIGIELLGILCRWSELRLR